MYGNCVAEKLVLLDLEAMSMTSQSRRAENDIKMTRRYWRPTRSAGVDKGFFGNASRLVDQSTVRDKRTAAIDCCE
jgi:hypothetical protein